MREQNEVRFWTLERNDGESMRNFVRRCWTEARGTSEMAGVDVRKLQETVVQDGYGSPYEFGRVLREMVGDPSAGVYSAYKGRTRVYYAWNHGDGDGPTLCALYDPYPGARNGPVDWFAAVDELGANAEDGR